MPERDNVAQTVKIDLSTQAVASRVMYGALFYALIRVKGIVTLPIMTRLLGPSDYGVFAVISTTVNMIWPVLALNLYYGCATYLVHMRTPADIARSYYSTLHATTLTTVIGAVVMVVTARWTGLDKAVSSNVALVACYVVVALWREMAVMPLQTFQRTTWLVVFNTATEYGSVFIGIGILLLGFGLSGFLWVIPLILFVGSLVLFARHLREFPYFRGIDWVLIRKFLAVSLPLLPVGFSQWALQSLDSYFILFYLGARSVGVNSVAYTLASLLLGLLTVLNYVYYPTLVGVWEQSRDRFFGVVHTSIRYVTLVSGWAIVVFAASSSFLVRLLAARNFGEAAPLVPLIATAFAFHTVTQMYQAAILTFHKKTVPIAFAYITGLIVNVVLNPVTIPRFGLTGAAWNTILGYGASHVLITLMFVQKSGQSVAWRERLKGIPPVALGWIAAYMTTAPDWTGALRALVTGTIVYLSAAFAIGLLERNDLRRLRALVLEAIHG